MNQWQFFAKDSSAIPPNGTYLAIPGNAFKGSILPNPSYCCFCQASKWVGLAPEFAPSNVRCGAFAHER